jgi:hypothetical protein
MKVVAIVTRDPVNPTGPPGVALDAFGNSADRYDINPFVRLLWRRGTLFERDAIAKLKAFRTSSTLSLVSP